MRRSCGCSKALVDNLRVLRGIYMTLRAVGAQVGVTKLVSLAMDAVPEPGSLDWLPRQVPELVLHIIVIAAVPVLLLSIFLCTRLATQFALYFADSWALSGMPRYKDPLAAWKMLWNVVDWEKFCAKMKRKDGRYHPMLNCGPSTEGRHWVAISAADLIQNVLASPEPDEETSGLYAKLRVASPTFVDAYTAWIGEGLLTAQGSKWHIHRKACLPLFFYTVLQTQLDFVSHSAHDLVRAIRIDCRPSNGPQSRHFSSPTNRLSQHIMRCLLHLIAGETVTREAQSPKARRSIDWMVTQQHTLVKHFRSSLEKASLIGGRVWYILGGPITNMLPWLGGEGNLHELQKERLSWACYFQSLLNMHRYDEEEDADSALTQHHDLLSILFHMKLDENFTIHHEMTRAHNARNAPSETNAPTPSHAQHTPTPPLPSRRNLLKRSMSGLRRSTASLVTTPPGSPDPNAPASTDDALDAQNTTSEDAEMEPAKTIMASASAPTHSRHNDESTKSKLKGFRVTTIQNQVHTPPTEELLSGDDNSTGPTSPLETRTFAPGPSNADFSPLETLAPYQRVDTDPSSSDMERSSNQSLASGWETSDEEEEEDEEEDEADGSQTDQNWKTLPYNSEGAPTDEIDDDPECVPGSQPPRPGHLPDETIIDQAFSFMAAGFQPTVSLLEWCLYYLASHPEQHAKLQHEAHLVLDGHLPSISHQSPLDSSSDDDSDSDSDSSTSSSSTETYDEAPMKRAPHIRNLRAAGSGLGLGDIKVTAAHLSQMTHARNFVKEVLRLHPTQPVVERITTDAVTLGGHKIPEGTAIGLMISNVHRDPALWKSPDTFWPERFESVPEDAKNGPVNVPSHPSAYIPFSSGHHSCIGQKYATQLVIITISLLSRAFQIEIEGKSEVKAVAFDGILSPENLRLRFIPRNFTRTTPSAPTPRLVSTIGSFTQVISPRKPPSSASPIEPKSTPEKAPSKTPVLSRRQKGPL